MRTASKLKEDAAGLLVDDAFRVKFGSRFSELVELLGSQADVESVGRILQHLHCVSSDICAGDVDLTGWIP